jgi:hypothetical protein
MKPVLPIRCDICHKFYPPWKNLLTYFPEEKFVKTDVLEVKSGHIICTSCLHLDLRYRARFDELEYRWLMSVKPIVQEWLLAAPMAPPDIKPEREPLEYNYQMSIDEYWEWLSPERAEDKSVYLDGMPFRHWISDYENESKPFATKPGKKEKIQMPGYDSFHERLGTQDDFVDVVGALYRLRDGNYVIHWQAVYRGSMN